MEPEEIQFHTTCSSITLSSDEKTAWNEERKKGKLIVLTVVMCFE